MKTRLLTIIFAATIIAFTGCKNISPQTARTIETQAVAAGVELGVLKAPTARPYIAAVTPIVCAEASGTNPSPAQIIAAIEASGAKNLKTPEAVIIVNGALGIYSAVISQVGTNSATLQNFAGGLCDGLTQGLAFSSGVNAPPKMVAKSKWSLFKKKSKPAAPKTLPPHIS